MSEFKNPNFMGVQDVMAALSVKEKKAYSIIKQFNEELNKKGIYTISGQVSKAYFEFRTGLNREFTGESL